MKGVAVFMGWTDTLCTTRFRANDSVFAPRGTLSPLPLRIPAPPFLPLSISVRVLGRKWSTVTMVTASGRCFSTSIVMERWNMAVWFSSLATEIVGFSLYRRKGLWFLFLFWFQSLLGSPCNVSVVLPEHKRAHRECVCTCVCVCAGLRCGSLATAPHRRPPPLFSLIAQSVADLLVWQKPLLSCAGGDSPLQCSPFVRE